MADILKSLDITNKDHRYDTYYNLPEKQERAISNKPIGSKHNKGNEVEGMFNKMWNFFDGGDIYNVK